MKKVSITGAGHCGRLGSPDIIDQINEITKDMKIVIIGQTIGKTSRAEIRIIIRNMNMMPDRASQREVFTKATKHLQNKGTRRSGQRRNSKPWNRR